VVRRIDLHTHSLASDGTQTPTELVRAAKAEGLDVLAITDHDTADGWAEAAAAATEIGVELVRGMEISARHLGDGVHLLGYLPDPTHPELDDALRRIRDGRGSRVPAMLERLRELGSAITIEDVRRANPTTPVTGRPHLADALVELGEVADRDEAFEHYLAAGRPAYVDRYAAPLEAMIDIVDRAGGISVIAHPWGRNAPESLDEGALAALAGRGLAGIEVDHEDHDPEVRERLRAIARNLGLVTTGSSDHHGLGKTGHHLGCNTTDPDDYERLLELAAAASARSGRATPPVIR
jgi:predicted metal-dependent phosphoesterase TrpH